MKKVVKVALALFGAALVLGMAACSNSSGGGGNGGSGVSNSVAPAPAGFVTVMGGTVEGGTKFKDSKNNAGVFVQDRTVAISTFYMCDHEVTQAEYNEVMGANPSWFNGTSGKEPATGETQGNRPVEQVNWYDAITYCNKKSIADGLDPCYTVSGVDFRGSVTVPAGYSSNPTWDAVTCDFRKNGYRLPTEAEWEYAARGGAAGCAATTPNAWAGTNNSSEAGNYAWHSGNSASKTHEVKTKTNNSLDLFDMSGNVCEWCWDWYNDSATINDNAYKVNEVVTNPAGASSGEFRVFRGGGYNYSAVNFSVAGQGFNYPYDRSMDFTGFRVVRTATSN